MRLFVAIRLPPAAEAAFAGVVETLRRQSRSGSFTRRENLHLTLAFLGETSRLSEANAAVGAVEGAPFRLVFRELGRFRREGGDLYWMGAEAVPALSNLHRSLVDALVSRGFSIEERPFRPHITLGRRVVPAPGLDREALAASLPEIPLEVNAVSLMESGRIQGKLTYTARFTKNLTDTGKDAGVL